MRRHQVSRVLLGSGHNTNTEIVFRTRCSPTTEPTAGRALQTLGFSSGYCAIWFLLSSYCVTRSKSYHPSQHSIHRNTEKAVVCSVFGRDWKEAGNNKVFCCCQGACKISTWLRDSVTAARTHIVLCCSTPGDLHKTEEWFGKRQRTTSAQQVCHPSLEGSERESVAVWVSVMLLLQSLVSRVEVMWYIYVCMLKMLNIGSNNLVNLVVLGLNCFGGG